MFIVFVVVCFTIFGNGLQNCQAADVLVQPALFEDTFHKTSSHKYAPLETEYNTPSKVKVLSLDGGAVGNITTLEWLKEVEQQAGKPVAEIFDVICASSSASIIAKALSLRKEEEPSKARFSAAEVAEKYKSLISSEVIVKRKSFTSSFKSLRKTRMLRLKKAFGDDFFTNSSPLTPVITIEENMSFDLMNCSTEGLRRKANPDLVVLNQTRQSYPGAKIEILSIGSGLSKKPVKTASREVSEQLTAESIVEHTKMFVNEMCDVNYQRFQTELSDASSESSLEEENLDNLQQDARSSINENREILQTIF